MIEREIIGVAALVALALACAAIAAGQPESVSLTIKFNLADARGLPFIGFRGQQPVVAVTFRNETLQKNCISCLFDIGNIELINGTAEFKFNLTVKWLGKLVHFSSRALQVDSSMNGTSIDLGVVKVQAANLEVYGVNDEGEKLGKCSLVVKELGVTLDCGESLTLPFGIYTVTEARYEVVRGTLVKVPPLATSFQVSNATYSVEISLGVASSYTIDVRRADDSPLSGADIEVVYVDGGNITLFKGVTQGEPLRLRNLPYGNYLVSVTWKTEPLLRRLIQVDRATRSSVLTTKLLPAAVLNVLDADGQPVAGLAIRVIGPAYDALALTDSSGRLVIQNSLEGLYTLRFNWMNVTLTRQVYLSTGEATVALPLRRLTLRLMPSAKCADRCMLPGNLTVKVLYRDLVLLDTSTAHSAKLIELPLPQYVLTNIPLKLEVYWNSTLLLSEIFTPGERVADFELQFFDLTIRVNDARGKPLPQAIVVVHDALGRRELASDAYGFVEVKHLYGGSAVLEVVWGGITVGRYLADASLGQVEVTTFVYPVVVEVSGVLGPVAGARVTVVVVGRGFSFNASAVTGSDGKVELRVPSPPGSNCTLLVAKGRIAFEKRVSSRELYGEGGIEVKLDLLLDIGPLQLRVWEAVTLTLVIALSLSITLFLYGHVSTRRALEKVFSIYGPEPEEEEEEERAGLLGRLKDIFGTESKEEEEEEEGELLFEGEF